MHLQHDLFCKFRLTCDFSEQVDYKQTMSWLVWVSPHLHSWKGQLELFMFCSVLLREMYLLRRLMRWLKWDVNKYHLLMHWVLGNSLTIDCKEAVFEVVFLFWILILTIKKLNYEFIGIVTMKAAHVFSYKCSKYSLYFGSQFWTNFRLTEML